MTKICNGFYYDFAREEPFTPDDLAKIEDRMREFVGRDLTIEREVWDRDQAKTTFKEIGEDYKVEIIEDIIPEGLPKIVSDYIDARIHAAANAKKPIRSMLLVSHMPFVSYLVDELCQSYTTSLFSTASIAVIKYSLSAHKGTLVTHYQGL